MKRSSRVTRRRSSRVTSTAPPDVANMLGIQPNDRDITLPASIAASVAEFHAVADETDTFDRQLGDFGDRYVVAGRDIEDIVGWPGRRVRRQDCVDDVFDVNVALALAAVA